MSARVGAKPNAATWPLAWIVACPVCHAAKGRECRGELYRTPANPFPVHQGRAWAAAA